ncbi:hypothetical protein EV401DRAFT_626624 [Pisolithus croceorrhizus]|nr:hypothetical protein EV401DRAFT_626624 [Pisolithus croceorrhizus]
MGRNALIGTARGWQSIRPKPSYTCRAQTQTPRSLVVAKLPPRQRFRTRPSKQLCQCDYVFVSALVVCSSLGVTRYVSLSKRVRQECCWGITSKPDLLGNQCLESFPVTHFYERGQLTLGYLRREPCSQGDTHNFMHSKAMTSSAWKWGVYERTRRC